LFKTEYLCNLGNKMPDCNAIWQNKRLRSIFMRARRPELTHTNFFQTVRSLHNSQARPVPSPRFSRSGYNEIFLKGHSVAISQKIQAADDSPLKTDKDKENRDEAIESAKELCQKILDAKGDLRISYVIKKITLEKKYPIQDKLCL